MRRSIWPLLATLALVPGLLLTAPTARAAISPGVSVAPQAGLPGTPFEIMGAGWAAGELVLVNIAPQGGSAATLEATADRAGRFRLTLDSALYQESTAYAVTAAGSGQATTRFTTVGADERCFAAETGQCVRGRFLDYWNSHGGLAINGYPLSPEFNEVLEDGKPYVVQYFERTRLEYHPENAATQEVLLGQFGRRLHPADPPAMPDPAQTWFPQTGHNVPSDFFAFWSSNGGLAQFGLPLSEAFQQQLEDGKTYRVQYFERARFEFHPEAQGPYTIQLGQFGRTMLDQAGR
jgi:hypothetical protein